MYEVGQVLFVVLKKKQKIIPVQVVEQIVRKSLESESIQYLVAAPGRDESINLDSLNADVYTDINNMTEALYENVRGVINTMAKRAQQVASDEFGFREPAPSPHKEKQYEDMFPEPGLIDTPKVDDEKVQVTFPDGTVGNLTIPDIENVG